MTGKEILRKWEIALLLALCITLFTGAWASAAAAACPSSWCGYTS